ncbi:MAG: ABC transporter ATP-binding protein [Bdellovibrionales bacterium]|nr:ABC transporter ATP-binding protein [Bdellovibrionales bacterium]
MLEILGVTKDFSSPDTGGIFQAVRGVDLTIKEGEFFSLLGPSGCGKTTLLRMISGFERPSGGTISLDGVRIDPLPANQRPFNLVFQKYALFPHLSVRENVAFGPKMKGEAKGWTREKIDEAVRESLALVQMEAFADRPITTLSGGQQQRIALARALANRPKILLLDEPLSALDLKLRQQMQMELLTLQRRLKMTFIFVTHDQEEALTLSDRIAVMNNGLIEQMGTPQEIYEYPRTPFVAQFIGTANSMEADIKEVQADRIVVQSPLARRPITVKGSRDGSRPLPTAQVGQSARVLIRPEKLKVLKSSPGQEQNVIEGVLKDILYLGPVTHFTVALPLSKEGQSLTVSVPNTAVSAKKTFVQGEKVYIAWFPEDCLLQCNGTVSVASAPLTTSTVDAVATDPVSGLQNVGG